MEIFERFKLQRKEMGLTQSDVAKRLGVTQQSYARIERGLSKPKASTITAICKALFLDPETLETDFYTSKPASAIHSIIDEIISGSSENYITIENYKIDNDELGMFLILDDYGQYREHLHQGFLIYHILHTVEFQEGRYPFSIESFKYSTRGETKSLLEYTHTIDALLFEKKVKIKKLDENLQKYFNEGGPGMKYADYFQEQRNKLESLIDELGDYRKAILITQVSDTTSLYGASGIKSYDDVRDILNSIDSKKMDNSVSDNIIDKYD